MASLPSGVAPVLLLWLVGAGCKVKTIWPPDAGRDHPLGNDAIDMAVDPPADAQNDARPDAPKDAQHDARPDAPEDAQHDAPEDAQHDARPDTQHDARPDAAHDAQYDARADAAGMDGRG